MLLFVFSYACHILSQSNPSPFIKHNHEFEVLKAVVMKNTIFRDITPCIPLKVNRRFGGTYRLHLQGRRIRQAKPKNMQVEIMANLLANLLSRWYLHGAQLFLR
jgi:hypothetical protein